MSGGCVIWSGYIAPDGYGRRGARPRPLLAHRWTYEKANGPIPAGMEIHHKCGNKACVNLEHLELVDRLRHRAIEREARPLCSRGHAYAEFGKNHPGRQAIYCTACKSVKDKARLARRQAA